MEINPIYDFIQRNRVLVEIEKTLSSKSSHLCLINYDLLVFHSSLLKCYHLKYLNLGHNKIDTIPQEIKSLRNLEYLSLEYNALQTFPKELENLPVLKTLNISHNPIKNLTHIGQLESLEVLWCNDCELTSLPDVIGNLQKLDTLGARRNKISRIPEALCSLKNIRWLTLEDNRIHCLPKQFENLQQLIHLNLNENRFSHIPVNLTKLKNLRYLYLQSNEIKSIPSTVIAKMKSVKINLLKNPISCFDDEINEVLTNMVLPGRTNEAVLDNVNSDSDASSSDYWENSLASSELHYSSSESEDSEEELWQIPFVIRHLVSF